jgi:hypothetical protein
MKSKKLINLGQRSSLQADFAWLEDCKKQMKQSPEQGDLLKISFPEWCKTLQIKTDKGLEPFELFPWQEQTADLIAGPNALTRRAIALLSSRQTGKTSLLLALSTYLAQSRRQFTAVVIHRSTQDAYLLCRRVKRFLSGVEMKTDSLSLLEFKSSGSAIHFRSSNPNKSDGAEQVGRGLESVDLVIVEEASHTGNLKDVLGVIAPCLTWSSMGLVCFVGTASSKQSYFFENLAKAAGSEEDLEKLLSGIRTGHTAPFQVLDRGKGAVGIVTNWRAIRRFRDEADFLSRVKDEFDLSDSQIDSEYELIFGSSVDSAVFDFSLVMAAQVTQEPYEHSDSHIIYIGVDAAGQGRDFAVAIALQASKEQDKDIYTVVQLYRKRTGVSEQHLGAINDMINTLDPLRVTIESNSMGQVWLENLAGMGFSYPIEGFSMTSVSKAVLIGRLQIALERGVLRIPKGAIIDELLAFRRKNNDKLEAGGNAHDDCVVALALALHSAGFNR